MSRGHAGFDIAQFCNHLVDFEKGFVLFIGLVEAEASIITATEIYFVLHGVHLRYITIATYIHCRKV